MYEKLESCPVCKNTHFQNFLICMDHTVSGESFALSTCTKCNLILTNPRPTPDNLDKYYDSEEYISHSNRGTTLINSIYKIVRRYTLHSKYKLLRSYTKGKKILDYGCGTGHFLAHLSKKGYEVYGYEPSQRAKNTIKSGKINFIEDLTKDNETYDVITAWHVIEHVPDPKKTLKILKKKLSQNGYMLIAVPNMNSFDAQHYQEHWAAYDVPRHLYHFNQKSFGKLIEKCKLTLIDTLPMRFDAYYVSMLSEKYQNNKSNFFRALKIGYQSNLNAKKTSEYSSLIYVLKK